MKNIVLRTQTLIFVFLLVFIFLHCFELPNKNNPPEQPQITCDYSTLDSVEITVISHDLDGDKIAYRLYVGTNMGTGFVVPPYPLWTSFYNSGIPVIFILDLSFPYTYYITAEAKDINDASSILSKTDTIIVNCHINK